MIERITCLLRGHNLTRYDMGMTVCQRCGLHDIDEDQSTKYKEQFMTTEQTHLPVNNQLTRLVSGAAFEKFVLEVFPNKIWTFPYQTSPVFVPNASTQACKVCEDAVETRTSGINGKHYHVSVVALIRHFSARGLIPEGHYLLLSNPKSHVVEQNNAGLSDESTVEGPKGVV